MDLGTHSFQRAGVIRGVFRIIGRPAKSRTLEAMRTQTSANIFRSELDRRDTWRETRREVEKKVMREFNEIKDQPQKTQKAQKQDWLLCLLCFL
jgi:hypothetical protein